MRLLIVLILALAPGGLRGADLSAVQKVYLLPMLGGLDQYLAEQLTSLGVFTVVVDPKQADAVWSERVDAGLTQTLNELYPPPKPAPAAAKDGKEKEKPAAEPEMKEQQPKRSYARARGNVFLVSVGARQVLWSHYHRAEDSSPEALRRAAQEIVRQLQKDRGEKLTAR